METETLPCAEGISDEILSAARDELLPVDELARLRLHTSACPACGARLAALEAVRATLLRQLELAPGDRIAEGVRSRISARPQTLQARFISGRGWTHRRGEPARRLSGGLGALVAATAVLLLFVYVLGTRPLAGSSTGKATPVPTATVQPSVTPLPAVSPVVDVATAWGPHAEVATLSDVVLDGTHGMIVTAITPDGHDLLGYTYPLPAASQTGQTQAGLLDVATRRFTPIGVSSIANPVSCCQTDGRFVVATDSESPGETCGVCHVRYWAYDLETGKLREVAVGHDFESILDARLSNGVLLLVTYQGVEAAHLAAGTIAPVAGLPPAGELSAIAFSWPYFVYFEQTSNAPGSVHIRDLASGHDTTLHQLDALQGPGAAYYGGAIVGDTLFYSLGTGADASGPPTLTTLYQVDRALDAGAPLKTIATYRGDIGPVLGANGRVVAFRGAVWDRVEQRFVQFGTLGGNPVSLSDNFLAVVNPGGAGTPGPVTIYDTRRLPVLP